MVTVRGKKRIKVYPPWKLKYWECLILSTLSNPYQQNSAFKNFLCCRNLNFRSWSSFLLNYRKGQKCVFYTIKIWKILKMLSALTQEEFSELFVSNREKRKKTCQITHTDNFKMLWSDFHNVNIVVDSPVEIHITVEQGSWSAFRISCNTTKCDF